MNQIQENYIATGKVVYVFYNLPLSFHAQAQITAEASECAGLQGKFWEMHDQIFLNQSEWAGKSNALDILLGYGPKIGLDQTAYAACLNNGQMTARVKSDAAFAASVGISGTPFFVVNSQGNLYAINGAQPYANFQQGLDRLLEENP